MYIYNIYVSIHTSTSIAISMFDYLSTSNYLFSNR